MNQKVTRNIRFLYLSKFFFIISTAVCFQAIVVNLTSFCCSSAVVNLMVNLGMSVTIKMMSLIYVYMLHMYGILCFISVTDYNQKE
jgi:hypothetical protein